MAYIDAHFNLEIILVVTVYSVRYKLPLPSNPRLGFPSPVFTTKVTQDVKLI